MKSILDENKLRWATMLVRTKPMQVILAEMEHRTKEVLDKEIAHNRELL